MNTPLIRSPITAGFERGPARRGISHSAAAIGSLDVLDAGGMEGVGGWGPAHREVAIDEGEGGAGGEEGGGGAAEGTRRGISSSMGRGSGRVGAGGHSLRSSGGSEWVCICGGVSVG